MKQLQVGDTVISIKKYDGATPKGKGIVTQIGNGLTRIVFPEWEGGHDEALRQATAEYKHCTKGCWNYDTALALEYLKKVNLTLKNILGE